MATNSARPAQLVLLATVARRHYLDGRSKVEIAEEFGLSRFKVARLLDAAHETGIVHIEIRHVDGIDVDLSARLQERFHLRHAIVVDTPRDDPADVRRHLGRAAADLLGEVITPEDVLGLAWARSVSAMATHSIKPTQLILLATVARRYFLDGRSKVEIAEEFGFSRFKVARLIEEARERGVVHIEIRHADGIDADLSARLQEKYQLQHTVVVDAPRDDPADLRQHLGRAAAELLAEVITPQDVLGLAWARSVSAMASALPRLPGVPVVQLTGALSFQLGDVSSIDLVRDVARAAGGPAYVFYAPFTVRDAATARALREQPEVAQAFSQLPRVTKAVAGVGFWGPGESTLYDAADERDRQTLRRLGVRADISGVFLSADGEPIKTELTERMIGIDAEQMRAIPEVIVIAFGMAKVPALRAALRSGLIGGVVTHTALAQALLDVT